MTDHVEPRHRFFHAAHKGRLALFGAGLLALGGATGAVVMAETRPSVTMAPATPVAIRTLSSAGTGTSIVTVRGRVAEIYGNKFIVDDGSGRALVDTGREGDDNVLVAIGQTVTTQGRFDRGFVRAAFLVGPDGKVQALGPLGGPPHGPRGGHDRGPDRGPHGGPDDGPGRGPDGDRDVPPPPPADGKAPPVAASVASPATVTAPSPAPAR